ncbi:MAG TPA: PQQ-binding-like beta-propeller repeat protein [Planctomycetota bacterium]|nr:PQQ-binding-like beta-propeller repeat protein [Planctomycetota bacterium]HRR79702.1 PQQ-binding-like beta-propeller repeat protein [Planctomycetota bacterium]
MKPAIPLLALCASAAVAAEVVDWPMYGFGPQRQSLSPTRFASATLEHVWSTAEPRTLYAYVEGIPYWSSPCLATVEGQPRVFIGCYDNTVYAFDGHTGKQDWAFITGSAVSAAPVYAIVGGRPMLFVASSDRSIFALDPRPGLPSDASRKLWQFETFAWRGTVNPARMADPLLAEVDGRPVLFCGVWNNNRSAVENVQRGEVIALEPATGTPLWRREIGTGAVNAPCLGTVRGEPALFVPYEPGSVFALSARTGKDLWPKPYASGDEIHSGVSVATVNGRQLLFLGGRTAWAYCVDAETGQQVWASPINTWVDSTPAFAVIDGRPTVFVGSYTYFLFALDAATGTELWRYRTRNIVQGSPALATMGDELVVCVNSLDDHVYVVTAREGRFLFRYDLGRFPWSHYRKGKTIWGSCVVGTLAGRPMLIAPSYSGVVHGFAVGTRDDNAGPPADTFWDALGEAYTVPVVLVVAAVLAVTLARLARIRRPH